MKLHEQLSTHLNCFKSCKKFKGSAMRALARLVVEFSPADVLEDGGRLLIQTNPLKQVHIVDTSVSKLSIVEGLVLLHVLSGEDGDVTTVHRLKNVIVCKIMAQAHGPVR
jgi:hypothetical protein